jgi:small subunit ribosomal protein S10e
MFIQKKDRLAIYTHVFREGAIAAKIDPTISKHPQINTPNLYVIMLMKSLVSRKYAERTYAWRWAYWTLTESGIEYLRNYLHLAPETVPNTYLKPTTVQAPPSFAAPRGEGMGARRGRGGARTSDRPPRDFDGERGSRFGGRGGARGGRGGARPSREQ